MMMRRVLRRLMRKVDGLHDPQQRLFTHIARNENRQLHNERGELRLRVADNPAGRLALLDDRKQGFRIVEARQLRVSRLKAGGVEPRRDDDGRDPPKKFFEPQQFHLLASYGVLKRMGHRFVRFQLRKSARTKACAIPELMLS